MALNAHRSIVSHIIPSSSTRFLMRLIFVMVLAVLMLISQSLTTMAIEDSANSRLTQEIDLIDCTNTNVQNGIYVATDTRCEGAIIPTVSPLKTTNRRPTISGSYDVGSTKTLRVFVSGRWYVLGASSLLTTSGNLWFLNLSSTPELQLGRHKVIVEVLTNEGLLLRNQGDGDIFIIERAAIKQETENIFNQPTTDQQKQTTIDHGVARTGKLPECPVVWWPIIVWIVYCLLAIWWWLFFIKSRKKRDD